MNIVSLIIIKRLGWLLAGAVLVAVLFLLNRIGLVSNEALAGKETKKIRIGKYIVVGIILAFMIYFFITFIVLN